MRPTQSSFGALFLTNSEMAGRANASMFGRESRIPALLHCLWSFLRSAERPGWSSHVVEEASDEGFGARFFIRVSASAGSKGRQKARELRLACGVGLLKYRPKL